jgi:hypothetical protein
MNRFVIVTLLFALAAAVVAYFGLPLLIRGNKESTRKVMMTSEHICTEGSVEKVENWSMSGFSRACVRNGVGHGKWVAWEGGRKVIDGGFLNGQENGVWTYLNAQGDVERVILYDRGRIVKDSLAGRDRKRGHPLPAGQVGTDVPVK